MSAVRGVFELSRAYLLQTIRSRAALLWTLAFPQVWLFLFALIYRNAPGGGSGALTGLLTITSFSGSFFGASYTLVSEREQGILRRFWVTPASALTIVAANSIRSLITVAFSLIFQCLIACLIFEVDFGASLAVVGAVLLFGVVAFVPLGLIMGSMAKDMRSAPAIGNLLFFPMVFLSGAALPIQMLPDWLQTFGRILPTTYLVDALRGVMVQGETLGQQWVSLGVLLLSGAVAFGANGLLFRWETTQPLGAKRVAMALGGLGVIYLLAAVFT